MVTLISANLLPVQILVTLPKKSHRTKTEKNEKYDFFFNGKFLVKKIRHDFDFGENRHEMVLSVVRDDLAVELEGVAESHEYQNKPLAPDTDTENFYNQQ